MIIVQIKKTPREGEFLFRSQFAFAFHADRNPAGSFWIWRPLEIRLFSGHISRVVVAAEQFAGAAHQITLAAVFTLFHIVV